MVETEIFRAQTEQERENYREVGSKTVFDRFRKKNVDAQQKATKAHRPYCFRCAKMDFDDLVEDKMKELGRGKKFEDLDFDELQKTDLEEYAREDRFKLLDETEAIDRVRVGVGTESKVIGHNKNYACKERGCGVSVLVPLSEKIDVKAKK